MMYTVIVLLLRGGGGDNWNEVVGTMQFSCATIEIAQNMARSFDVKCVCNCFVLNEKGEIYA